MLPTKPFPFRDCHWASGSIGAAEGYGGYRGGKSKHKVSLYVDDQLLFVSEPATSLPEALTVLQNFSQFSGYKLNLNKSELFPINKKALKLNYTDH